MIKEKMMAALMALVLMIGAPAGMKAQKDLSMRPSNVVKVSVGPSFVPSKVYAPIFTPVSQDMAVATGKYKMKNLGGIDAAATYQHLWGIGIGIGVDYIMNTTWLAEDLGHFNLHYIGPSFVFAYRGWKRFGIEVAEGIGYVREHAVYYPPVKFSPWSPPAHQNEESMTENNGGIGFMSRVGAEYRFTKHLGLGAAFCLATSRFHLISELGNDETVEPDGIIRLSLQLGLHYYF